MLKRNQLDDIQKELINFFKRNTNQEYYDISIKNKLINSFKKPGLITIQAFLFVISYVLQLHY